jgi:hypothetical protein
MPPPRYCPDRPLPPYSYVPGLAPHPMSDPRGHSFGWHEPAPQPLDEATYSDNAAYRYAIDLFNHGFYWEAHEVWESLWHAAGRHGTTADFLKGLIKLAAAGVKAREGKAAGVRQHAARAAELFSNVAEAVEFRRAVFGLPLGELIVGANGLQDAANELASNGVPDAGRMVAIKLVLLPSTQY